MKSYQIFFIIFISYQTKANSLHENNSKKFKAFGCLKYTDSKWAFLYSFKS